MAPQGRPSGDTVSSNHGNTGSPEVSCMADYLDSCSDVLVEEVPSKTFNDEAKTHDHVVSAAGIRR